MAHPRDPSIIHCLYCLSNCLTAAKTTLFPSSSHFHLTSPSLVLCRARLCSAVQNQRNLYAQEAGISVNPAAFDGDETVLDEACILQPQPLRWMWNHPEKKSNYLMPFKSVTLLKTVESKIFRAVAWGLWPPFCCNISLHYEAYFIVSLS